VLRPCRGVQGRVMTLQKGAGSGSPCKIRSRVRVRAGSQDDPVDPAKFSEILLKFAHKFDILTEKKEN